MARIDYHKIERQIQSILKSGTNAKLVVIEEEIMHDVSEWPWIGIYLTRREAPEDQPIAAGKRTLMNVRFSIWGYTWSIDGLSQAANDRDNLIGSIETSLMGNRTLNEEVETSWLQGGEFVSARNDNDGSFLMGAEVVLEARAKGIA